MRLWPSKRRARGSRWAGKDVTGLIPVRRVESTPDLEREGCDVLLLPRFRSGPAARWIQPRLRPERAHIRVRLDPHGTFVWRCVDGRTTVGEIIARFEAAHPDQNEVPGRVWMFLTAMERNGLVGFHGEAGHVDARSA